MKIRVRLPIGYCPLPLISEWTFLRWFFTLDGEFNAHSGQITISQRNERNIVTLAYLLQMFSIVPRFSSTTVVTNKGPVSTIG